MWQLFGSQQFKDKPNCRYVGDDKIRRSFPSEEFVREGQSLNIVTIWIQTSCSYLLRWLAPLCLTLHLCVSLQASLLHTVPHMCYCLSRSSCLVHSQVFLVVEQSSALGKHSRITARITALGGTSRITACITALGALL